MGHVGLYGFNFSDRLVIKGARPMILPPNMIKAALKSFGIHDLSVRFDCDDKEIIAIYTRSGNNCRKTIPFSEIESTFSDGPQGGLNNSESTNVA